VHHRLFLSHVEGYNRSNDVSCRKEEIVMARVRLLDYDQVSPDARKVFEKLVANGAKILNIYRALAHCPPVMLDWMRLGNTLLTKSKLPAKLRELVILRIARLSGSKYEWTQHCPVAIEAGVTERQINEIDKWKESEAFSSGERAALQYTDEVVQSVSVNDETYDQLKSFLSEQEIVELTLSIGYWMLTARVLVPLKIDMDVDAAVSASDLTGRKL